MDPEKNTIKIYSYKTIVEEVEDPDKEISLEEARKIVSSRTLITLTILTLAPSIIIMTTSFIRIVIVLSLTRQAIGTATLPPNQVIVGLALILTFFVMSPTLSKINETAYQPYMKNIINLKQKSY